MSLISETLVESLDSKRSYSNFPVRVTGLNAEIDYISNEVVNLTLANLQTKSKQLTTNLTVLPNSLWRYTPPSPVANWISDLKLKLADPEVLDPSIFPLNFQIILSVGCSIQILNPVPLYRTNQFEVRNSQFGYVLAGENPPLTAKGPEMFLKHTV